MGFGHPRSAAALPTSQPHGLASAPQKLPHPSQQHLHGSISVTSWGRSAEAPLLQDTPPPCPSRFLLTPVSHVLWVLLQPTTPRAPSFRCPQTSTPGGLHTSPCDVHRHASSAVAPLPQGGAVAFLVASTGPQGTVPLASWRGGVVTAVPTLWGWMPGSQLRQTLVAGTPTCLLFYGGLLSAERGHDCETPRGLRFFTPGWPAANATDVEGTTTQHSCMDRTA